MSSSDVLNVELMRKCLNRVDKNRNIWMEYTTRNIVIM